MQDKTQEPLCYWALHRVPGVEGDAPVILHSDQEVGGDHSVLSPLLISDIFVGDCLWQTHREEDRETHSVISRVECVKTAYENGQVLSGYKGSCYIR